MRRRRIVAACLLSAAAGFALAVVIGPRTGITPKRRPRSVVFFRARTTKRIVALTFDDGPDPRWTPRVLELLHEHRAHATFFLIGRNAQAHPELVHDELAEGHEVGNHTYDHPDLETLTPAQVSGEIDKGAQALEQAGAQKLKYFRPPKGLTDEVVGVIADVHRYRTIFWDLTLEHFVDHAEIFQGVQVLLSRVRPGSIILAHDGGIPNRTRTMQALPILLDGLKARGYRMVDVSQLLSVSKGANR